MEQLSRRDFANFTKLISCNFDYFLFCEVRFHVLQLVYKISYNLTNEMVGRWWRAVGAKLSKYEHYEITGKAYKNDIIHIYYNVNSDFHLFLTHALWKQDATHSDNNQAQNNIAKQNICTSCKSHVWSLGNKVQSRITIQVTIQHKSIERHYPINLAILKILLN